MSSRTLLQNSEFYMTSPNNQDKVTAIEMIAKWIIVREIVKEFQNFLIYYHMSCLHAELAKITGFDSLAKSILLEQRLQLSLTQICLPKMVFRFHVLQCFFNQYVYFLLS